MAFPIDPGRPPGIQPLENQVPNQGNVDLRAMLPLANAREQQHHDVIQHAGLGHGQHDDQDMNLEDMLPLRQAFNLDQDDAMLEDDNNQLREHNLNSSFQKGLCKLSIVLTVVAKHFHSLQIWCESTLLEDVAGGALRAVSAPSARIFAFCLGLLKRRKRVSRENGEHTLDYFS